MSDALLIAIITGVFGLLGKALDLSVQRSKANPPPKRKSKADAINPTTHGGILNPATIGLLAVGIVIGFLVVRIPGVTHSVPTPTPIEVHPTETQSGVAHPTETQPPGGLHIGGHALIHTTAGDKLRIHKSPDYNGTVTATLVDGTLVTVAEGPVTIGTDHWWRVETLDGRTGWAVDFVEGVQTLIPSP
jgi:hypothetical protein